MILIQNSNSTFLFEFRIFQVEFEIRPSLFTTKYNILYFIICGPLAKFLLIKLILRPAQQFEFDMPVLFEWHLIIYFRICWFYWTLEKSFRESWMANLFIKICRILKKKLFVVWSIWVRPMVTFSFWMPEKALQDRSCIPYFRGHIQSTTNQNVLYCIFL